MNLRKIFKTAQAAVVASVLAATPALAQKPDKLLHSLQDTAASVTTSNPAFMENPPKGRIYGTYDGQACVTPDELTGYCLTPGKGWLAAPIGKYGR